MGDVVHQGSFQLSKWQHINSHQQQKTFFRTQPPPVRRATLLRTNSSGPKAAWAVELDPGWVGHEARLGARRQHGHLLVLVSPSGLGSSRVRPLEREHSWLPGILLAFKRAVKEIESNLYGLEICLVHYLSVSKKYSNRHVEKSVLPEEYFWVHGSKTGV